LDQIFDVDFLEVQQADWASVKATVKKPNNFDYYVEILQQVIDAIRKKMASSLD